jgi:hypothetical protein
MNFLNGYKTYIVAALLIVVVVSEKLLGWDIPGVQVGDNWLDYVAAAFGLGALRHGVAKAAAHPAR